jgi:hypothetical protein
MSHENSKANLKKGSVPKSKQVNVRTLLNEACIVAGNIIAQLGEKTANVELLNQNELANYKTAVDVLKNSRELTLKTNALKSAQKEIAGIQQPLVEVDTATLLKLTRGNSNEG